MNDRLPFARHSSNSQPLERSVASPWPIRLPYGQERSWRNLAENGGLMMQASKRRDDKNHQAKYPSAILGTKRSAQETAHRLPQEFHALP
jgi:hypothetical protein